MSGVTAYLPAIAPHPFALSLSKGLVPFALSLSKGFVPFALSLPALSAAEGSKGPPYASDG